MLSASLPFKYYQTKNKFLFEVKDGKVYKRKEKFINTTFNFSTSKDFLQVLSKVNINNTPTYINDVYSSPLEKLNTGVDSLNVLNNVLTINNTNFVAAQFILNTLDLMSIDNNTNTINQDLNYNEIEGSEVDVFVSFKNNAQNISSLNQITKKTSINVISDQLYVKNKADNLNLKIIDNGSGNYVINQPVTVENPNSGGGNGGTGGQYKEFWA